MVNISNAKPNAHFNTIEYYFIVLFLVLLTGFTVFEIYEGLIELKQGVAPWEVWLEILIVSALLGFVFYIISWLYNNIRQQKRTEQKLEQVKQQLNSSNERLQKGKEAFRESVGWQLNEWQFTQGQKEIAYQLLKGLAIKDIAKQRHVAEKTVRNHLTAIYEKSGLSGRHVFCSWFLEGLL